MFKLFIFGVIIAAGQYSLLFAAHTEKTTYDFLCENRYSDNGHHFQKIFQNGRINSFIEFGESSSTKYFLDHCRKVTTCEIVLSEQSDSWSQDRRFRAHHNYSNWSSIVKKVSRSFQNAAQIMVQNQVDPSLFDGTYLLEMKDICDGIFENDSFEMAHISPSVHLRGDLINELFDRVQIIVATETHNSPDLSRWAKVNTPSNYEKIVFPQGQGMIFWIHKDRASLINALLRNSSVHQKKTKKRKLRIFFPQMHPVLVQSMALALQDLGHTLVLPGESFDPNSPYPGFKIPYGSFFKKRPLDTSSFTSYFSESPDDCTFLRENVEMIENNELLTNPPDVLFINCLEVEKSVCKIWKYFAKIKENPPKLAHYSGNNSSRYKSKYVKNLIAVDAYTANFYDPTTTNIIFWIPWIDFDNLKFEGATDSLVMNSYISHYYKDFLLSSEIFSHVIKNAKNDFPNLTIVSYPNSKESSYVKHNKIASLINDSCATIHIKETEGFGYTIIESLAKGRPVFLKRSFSLGSRLMNWCIEGKTAFFFDDYDELQSKLHKYLNNKEFRHQVQIDCAQTIRKFIDNKKQARILDQFLQNLD